MVLAATVMNDTYYEVMNSNNNNSNTNNTANVSCSILTSIHLSDPKVSYSFGGLDWIISTSFRL